jgi:hypothetical protein
MAHHGQPLALFHVTRTRHWMGFGERWKVTLFGISPKLENEHLRNTASSGKRRQKAEDKKTGPGKGTENPVQTGN